VSGDGAASDGDLGSDAAAAGDGEPKHAAAGVSPPVDVPAPLAHPPPRWPAQRRRKRPRRLRHSADGRKPPRICDRCRPLHRQFTLLYR
jgi:hypothetical protein